MANNNKTTNFFVENSKMAWKKQSTLNKKFDVRNFHVDTYKEAFGKNSAK